jgi:hypothetical protein
MKTHKLVLLAALLTIGLVACGGGSDGDSCANKTATTSVAKQDVTPKVAVDTGCSSSLLGVDPDPVVGTTVHDNKIQFAPHEHPSSIKSVAFEWDQAYSITPGQPWEGLDVSIEKNGYGDVIPFMTVKAGRKGSSTPQDWFNARNAGAKISDESSWRHVGTLNFAFTGYLVINDDRYLVTMAQEGLNGTNGWWLAGQQKGWTYQEPFIGDNYLLTPDKKWEIKGAEYYRGFEITRH